MNWTVGSRVKIFPDIKSLKMWAVDQGVKDDLWTTILHRSRLHPDLSNPTAPMIDGAQVGPTRPSVWKSMGTFCSSVAGIFAGLGLFGTK